MSIYATLLSIDDHDHEASCAVYRLFGEYPSFTAAMTAAAAEPGVLYMSAGGDRERVYARVPGASCTCGNPPPLVYQGSHVNPSSDGPRGGSVTFCAIPGFLHPDATPEMRQRDEGFPVDFARLWVVEDPATYGAEGEEGHATVVLERAQVEKLRDTLTRWLEAGERE